jgi:hypothetical protein
LKDIGGKHSNGVKMGLGDAFEDLISTVSLKDFNIARPIAPYFGIKRANRFNRFLNRFATLIKHQPQS